MQKAKIFMTGKSQAISLPKAYCFDASEVCIIPPGRSMILHPINNTWFEVFSKILPTGDFFKNGRKDLPSQEREFFK